MSKDTAERKEKNLFQGAIEVTGALHEKEAISYVPVPHAPMSAAAKNAPTWRIRISSINDTAMQAGFELNGEVVLGRDVEAANMVNLKKWFPDLQGVSRKHLALRPTTTNLYAIDIGSTNGTWRNGRSIGFNSPTPINNGDVLDLGGTQLLINIVDRPNLQTGMLQEKLDLADALSQMAKAITSQLDPDEVLLKVLETAQILTSADETAIWLMDEASGELFLEVQQGIEDEQIRRMRLPASEDNLVGKVLKTSEPLRAYRKPGEEQIKVKTGYLVESLLFVPITLGGVTFGVIGAGQRKSGKPFSQRDERLLIAIADFAAIAIQNARLYKATDIALARRVQELTALNEVARAVTSSLDLSRVYDVLVEQVMRNWPVKSVQLYLYNETVGGLFPLVFGKNLQRPRPISRGIMWQVAQRRKPVFTNNAPGHKDFAPTTDMLDSETLPKSMACVPLSIKDKVVGVLTLFDKQDGDFTLEDVARLEAFSHPVATAVENARLFAESRRQQAAILATARTINEPLIIMDDQGSVLVSNEAAQELLNTNMSQLFDAISRSVGRTTEVMVADNTYLATSQHLPEVGTIAVMQDITYVKQLEKDRAEFMRALSHDLKSPLTSIKGFAQLLSKVMTLNEKGERFVGQIISATERMLEMIHHLLQVTHEDLVELERTAVDLHSIIAEVIDDVEGAALSKSIDILFDSNGEPYRILADPVRLYHMTLNLIDNAIKYSPVETKVKVLLNYTPENVVIEVEDEGYGIPQEDLPRVFEKFYRGKQTAGQHGTGVGLSVVAAIAQAHEGKATAENRPAGGSVFRVILPGKLRTDG